ncbi:sensor histidine kinase, partial [Streptosporangium algeriense]
MSGNRIARALVGVLAGAALGLVELVFLCGAALVRPVPAVRPGVERVLNRLTALERARLAAWFDHDTTGHPRRDGRRYLAVRALFGLLAGYGCAAGLFLGGLFLFGGLWNLAGDRARAVPVHLPGVRLVTSDGVLGVTGGLVVLALTVLGLLAVGVVERRLADHFLGPGTRELMRRRIAELTATRSGVVRAVDDERRRIERDLHDGAQQRLLSVAMDLGRAQTKLDSDPETARRLLAQAHEGAKAAITELRDLARGIHPAILTDQGLEA